MSETQAPAVPQNGVAPAPSSPPPAPPAELQLPEGTIRLPDAVVSVLLRYLQTDQRTQDVLYAYLQGRGDSERYALQVPVVLLSRAQGG